jgi:hypothetical protein
MGRRFVGQVESRGRPTRDGGTGLIRKKSMFAHKLLPSPLPRDEPRTRISAISDFAAYPSQTRLLRSPPIKASDCGIVKLLEVSGVTSGDLKADNRSVPLVRPIACRVLGRLVRSRSVCPRRNGLSSIGVGAICSGGDQGLEQRLSNSFHGADHACPLPAPGQPDGSLMPLAALRPRLPAMGGHYAASCGAAPDCATRSHKRSFSPTCSSRETM